MQVERFEVKEVKRHGNTFILHVWPMEFMWRQNGHKVYNTDPFNIVVDERGFILNDYERVRVTLVDIENRKVVVDSMYIQGIASHRLVSQEIYRLTGCKVTEWNTVFEEVDQQNVKVTAYAQEVEMELLLEDLLLMNREHAIDMALDTGDVEAFMKLTGGRENELITTV